MTRQEAYEKARAYLTRPGARRAFDPEPVENEDGETFEAGVCRYEIVLDGETHNCAVGCLLEREDLDRSMASFIGSTDDLFNKYGVPDYFLELAPGPVEVDPEADDWYEHQLEIVGFLEGLQSIHDAESNWMGGKFNVERLDAWAADNKLTVVSS